jgi:hypothetical protein
LYRQPVRRLSAGLPRPAASRGQGWP